METYSAMREFADSWMLLFLTLFFLGVIAWVMRPGSTGAHRDSAEIPFRHDDEPADSDDGETCRKEART